MDQESDKSGMEEVLNVLVVDDNETDRTAVRRAITSVCTPAQVREAADCQGALAELSRKPYDCVFLDVQLPDGDGMTLVREMCTRSISAPVIVLAGQGDERAALEVVKAGAWDYLSKASLSPEVLAQSLRSVLRIHRAERQVQAADAARRESEDRFRMMADNAPVLIWVADQDGKCNFFNQVWLDFTGRAMEEEVGDGWEASIHPEDLPHVKQSVADALKRKRRSQSEFRLRRADGTYRWMLNTSAPRFAPDGGLVGFIGSCVDITERKQAEEMMRLNQEHIASLNERLKRAMTETHHRVKNNLQIIAAMVDMRLLDNNRTVSLDELKQLGLHIHMLAVVHDILTEQAKEDGEGQYVSAKAVLERLLPMVQKMAGNRLIHFGIEDAKLSARQGTSLAIVANELVSNAIKYGRNEVEVHFSVTDKHGVLEICDDGPGFAEGFDPRAASRTGLELVESLSRWDLGGRTSYDTRPEGGGHVTVTIPLPD
jgi:PAS domain S-box-containing protein